MILKRLIEREYGKLEAREYTKDTYYLSNSKFAIGRGLRISIGKIPDIVIWKNPSEDLKRRAPDRAIEIKVYTAKRSKESVRDAIDRLKSIKAAKNSFKGMLIFYSCPSKFDEVKESLDKEDDWLTWIVLESNSKNFVEILRAWLRQSDGQV